MKLIFCHVENFGRLHDFDYMFSDGVNVICRENGWGKSTFAAFLVAMFYGLPSRGKKGQTGNSRIGPARLNARALYRPWQGGIFGGRIVFEAGGKTLEMIRIFGDREAEDEFDLRDTETNLPCFDYTKNIGKELFMLDRESFLRTVCTAQQDCATGATDDVNALVADLADYAGDMESYEAAQKLLKEASNRLTPKRTTGRLYQLNEQIGRLEKRTADAGDLEERIEVCSRTLRGLEEKKAALEAERAQLGEAIAAAEKKEEDAAGKESLENALLAKRLVLQRLDRTMERRQEALQKAFAYFPNRVPTRAEADVLLQKCREMERLEERMQTEMLSEKEQERLTALEEQFSDVPESEGDYRAFGLEREDSSSESEGEYIFPESEGECRHSGLKGKYSFSGSKTKNSSPGPKRKNMESAVSDKIRNNYVMAGMMLFLAGAALMVLLVVMGAVKGIHIPVPVFAATAFFLAAAGAVLVAVGFFRIRDIGYGSGHSAGYGFVDESCGDEESARVYAEYMYLQNKEKKLEKTHADWAEARKPVLRFLKELGFSPEEDLHAQLTSIRDAADDCEDARALLSESREELRLFEEELRRDGLMPEELRRTGFTREELQRTASMPGEGVHTGASPSPAAVGSRRRPGTQEYIPPDYSAQEEKEGEQGEQGKQGEQSAAALRQRREQAHEELLQCRIRAADEERRMEDLIAERDERDALLGELQELRKQRETDQAEYRHVTMASSLLQKARESMTARYADPIRNSFCRYWEMITGYSAANVYVDANTRVSVEERGKPRDITLLSTGWRDLAGICLRIALADAMYPPNLRERPPLILDDPFTNLDDEKTEGAMRFLRETGRQYQILYFTCSSART